MEATCTRPASPPSSTRRGEAGFTLVELVMTLTLASIVALVPASILLESMRVYARLAPSIDASYQARLAGARLRHDLRTLEDGKIGLAGNTLTLTAASGDTTVYLLVDGRLTRNGDLLARGVKALKYTLRGRDGGALQAADAADTALVECDLSLTLGGSVHRTIVSVCPGFVRHDATAGVAAAKAST